MLLQREVTISGMHHFFFWNLFICDTLHHEREEIENSNVGTSLVMLLCKIKVTHISRYRHEYEPGGKGVIGENRRNNAR